MNVQERSKDSNASRADTAVRFAGEPERRGVRERFVGDLLSRVELRDTLRRPSLDAMVREVPRGRLLRALAFTPGRRLEPRSFPPCIAARN